MPANNEVICNLFNFICYLFNRTSLDGVASRQISWIDALTNLLGQLLRTQYGRFDYF